MARTAKKLVICLDDTGYEASLERRKIYVSIPDPKARELRLIRVIDESGEDYLYDERAFGRLSLPPALRRAVMSAAD